MGFLSLAEVETIARTAHAGQVDKAGRPYAEHLAAVADGVRRRRGGEEQIAAAWLHDAVEDEALTWEWLASAALPESTKAIVAAVTKRAGEDAEAYAARILATPGAALVKDCDLAHNADPRRLCALDVRTAARLTAKYARMRRLLHPLPAAQPVAADADPGDAVLLAQLDRGNAERWRELAAIVDSWSASPQDVTGRPGTLYPVYSARVNAVTGLLSALGAVTPAYHWMAFPPPLMNPDGTFTPGDAVRAATATVRGERFSDGTIGTAYLNGTLYAICVALLGRHRDGNPGG